MFKLFTQTAAVALVLATSMVAMADPVGGPKGSFNRVEAYSSSSFTLDCRGGEWTAIRVVGDGDTDLDLYVYDCYGTLMTAGESYSDIEEELVLPHFRQSLTIKVVNRGNVYNQFYHSAW